MSKIVYLRTSSLPIPRISRVAHVAKQLGYQALFIGALRDLSLDRNTEWDGMRVVRVGKYFPLLNGVGLLNYIKGVASYNYAAYKVLRVERPAIVHFSDVESFFAVFAFCLFSKSKTIYNIHDNFSQRYPLPKYINFILNIFEGLIVKFSTATIVPEIFRAEGLPNFCRNKITVVRNTPIDPGLVPHEGFDGEKIKIVFAGWLDDGRGVNTLLDLAELNPRIDLQIAGEGSAEIIEKLEACPSCHYHGFLNHTQVLNLTSNCDFVFAHYSPHRSINIHAAPNKLAEALAIGRPVIINSEALVSKTIAKNNCGIVTPYGDVEKLLEAILRLSDDVKNYASACDNARKLFERDYSWENVKETTARVLKKVGEQ